MALNLQHVKRGDLLTADFMNAIVDAAIVLDARLTALETGGATPVLSDWSPAGDIPVLSQLTLIGDKFLQPSDQNTVTMDGTFPIQQFLGGTDAQHLVLQVPNVFANLPRLIPVQVTNKNGTSNQLQIRITPAAPVQGGQVVVFQQTPPLGVITVGTRYTLQWLVDSQTLLPATYTPQVIFTNVKGASPAAWQSNTILSPTGQLSISPGRPLTVTARVTVPNGAVSATVALQVTSSDGMFQQSSDDLSLTVGQATVVSDPRVLLTIDTIPPLDPQTNKPNPVKKVTINGVDGIQIPFGVSGTIPIKVQVTNDATATGNYSFTAAVDTPAGLWNEPTVTPAAPTGMTALSSRTIEVLIGNTDAANSTTIKMIQVSAAHTPTGGNASDFTSFIRFPIQGYVGS